MEWQDDHRGAYLDFGGACGYKRGEGHDVGTYAIVAEVVLGDPHAVEAEFL